LAGRLVKAGGGKSKNSQLLKIPFPNPDRQLKKDKKKVSGAPLLLLSLQSKMK
jgi:hypothetical protein